MGTGLPMPITGMLHQTRYWWVAIFSKLTVFFKINNRNESHEWTKKIHLILAW